jgi:hypothetical protein
MVLSSHYHQGTHCVTIPLSSRYSLCYHPIIRVLTVLSSGYSLCYHPTIISVIIVLPCHYHHGTVLLSYHQGTQSSSQYHQGTHCVILLPSGY